MPKIVVLDPGHGGKDPGAVAHGLAEKDVVLRLGRMVRDELSSYDADVRMTRDSDTFIELSDRASFANRLGAALFVSLHCNAGGGQGFESFVYEKPSTASVSYQNVIHGEVMAYLRGYGITDRGRKRANLAVCRETRMPAVLLENLFIDNARENALLRDEVFLRGLAKATALGIAKALGLREKPKPNPMPKKPAPAKPTPTNKGTTRATNVVYSVQTGAFADRANAERLAEELRKKGYAAVIVEKPKGGNAK